MYVIYFKDFQSDQRINKNVLKVSSSIKKNSLKWISQKACCVYMYVIYIIYILFQERKKKK